MNQLEEFDCKSVENPPTHDNDRHVSLLNSNPSSELFDSLDSLASSHHPSSRSRAVTRSTFSSNSSSDSPLPAPFPFDYYLRAFISLLFFAYFQLSSSAIRYFHCIEVGNSSILYDFPSTSCSSTGYSQWKILIILILTIVSCIPITLLVFLFVNRSYVIFRK